MTADDPRQSQAEDAPEVEVEEIRRSLARGGRPRVGRRFDAVMQKAKTTRAAVGRPEPEQAALRQDGLPMAGPVLPDPPEDLMPEELDRAEPGAPESGRAWAPPGAPPRSATAADPPGAATSMADVPDVETVDDPVLRADELAAPRTVPQVHQDPASVGGARGRALAILSRPPTGAPLMVALIALVAFGLGIVVGDWLRAAPAATPVATPDRVASAPTEPAPSAPATTPAPAPAASSPARAPRACLDTARLGDQVINLLTANVRDRRLDEALRRYATASQQCRQAASQSP